MALTGAAEGEPVEAVSRVAELGLVEARGVLVVVESSSSAVETDLVVANGDTAGTVLMAAEGRSSGVGRLPELWWCGEKGRNIDGVLPLVAPGVAEPSSPMVEMDLVSSVGVAVADGEPADVNLVGKVGVDREDLVGEA